MKSGPFLLRRQLVSAPAAPCLDLGERGVGVVVSFRWTVIVRGLLAEATPDVVDAVRGAITARAARVMKPPNEIGVWPPM